jgi:Na+-translocating ferredoxin:NAD+ oxidoreductase subunit G
MKTSSGNLILSSVVICAPAYAAQYVTVDEAKKILFPDAASYEPRDVKFDDELRGKIKKLGGKRQGENQTKIIEAKKAGSTSGWILIDDVVGKHEFITYATGIDLSGKVVGIEILDYRETHGGQIRDVSWRKKFTGKQLNDPFQLDVDVPNISGATLSCRNVLDGVKRLLAIHQLVLAKSAK